MNAETYHKLRPRDPYLEHLIEEVRKMVGVFPLSKVEELITHVDNLCGLFCAYYYLRFGMNVGVG